MLLGPEELSAITSDESAVSTSKVALRRGHCRTTDLRRDVERLGEQLAIFDPQSRAIEVNLFEIRA